MSPFFSVIIPVFNRAYRLSCVLQSLKDQTFKDFETIIIDDASTDNSYEVAQAFDLQNKKILRNEVNSERCVTRNKGINEAKGKYICFLDSDDEFLPSHLAVFYNFLKNNREPEAMVFSNSFIQFEDGRQIEKNVPVFPGDNKFAYLLKYTPNPARVCVAQNILQKEQFDPAIPGVEDLDLWLRIAKKHAVFHIPEFTSIYYIHLESYTLGDRLRFQKELKYFKYIFQKPELGSELPTSSKKRLLSRSHYFIACQYFDEKNTLKTLKHSSFSLVLQTKWMEKHQKRSLFVMIGYSLPFIGSILKKTWRLTKR